MFMSMPTGEGKVGEFLKTKQAGGCPVGNYVFCLYKLVRTLFLKLVVKVTGYEDRITSNAYHAGSVNGGVSCNLKPNVRKPSFSP